MSAIVPGEKANIATEHPEKQIAWIKTQLQPSTSPEAKAIIDLFQENAALKRENEMQARALKGLVLVTVKDVVRQLLDELKKNPEYQEKVRKDLMGLGKMDLNDFIRSVEREVQIAEESASSKNIAPADWVLLGEEEGKPDIKKMIHDHLIKTYEIRDPHLTASASTFRKLCGYAGSGVAYTCKSLYLLFRVAYWFLQIRNAGYALAPALPIALFLLRSYTETY